MANVDKPSVFERSKHPLVVLAFSTAIGAILIPSVTARIAREHRRLDLRTAHAAQALQSSADAERSLALVILEFKSFVEYESVEDPAARAALRQRIRALWADFDRKAWWWHWSALQEAQVLRLLDEREARAMRAAVDSYQANLVSTAEALNPLSALLLSEQSRPRADLAASALVEFNNRARALQQERTTIVGALINPLLE